VTIAWSAAGSTDVGRRRSGNEDTLRVHEERGFFLVADGMGGHAAGEIASDLAASTLESRLSGIRDEGIAEEELLQLLRQAVLSAHEAIVRCCEDDPRTLGMGTTLTACLLSPRGRFLSAHIGDSRLYRLRGGELEQLTRDHTWVQREIDEGRLTPAAADSHPLGHILTRVLSQDVPPEPDLLSGVVAAGDVLLLATDGLYNMVPEPAIAEALRLDLPVAAISERLIESANRAGGTDNITVVVVRIRQG
jgi:PPM family protein phosphatase